MADYFIEDSTLKSLANAIRAHTGGIGDLTPNYMAETIRGESQNVRDLVARTYQAITHSGITSIGPYAFYKYSSLSKIDFPNCSVVDSTAFAGCTNIREVTLGITELSIENFPLKSATATLTMANFPSCRSVIGNAFSGCTVLSAVSLPTCTVASTNAFTGCKSLQTATIGFSEFTKDNNVLAPVLSTLTMVSAPMCTTVGASAFAHYSVLTSISFPVCTSLGDYAFGNCASLVSASFPACTTLGPTAFGDCIGLSAIDLPVCTSIGTSAFYSCSSLSAIHLPSCTRIGNAAFDGCTKLLAIVLSGSSIPFLNNVAAFANTPITNSSYTGGFGSVYVPASLVSKYKTAVNWIDIADRITEIESN